MRFEKFNNFLTSHQNTIESLANLSTILESVAALVTMFGIVFLFVEYNMQQKTNREEKAFELYQQFNSGYFMETRNVLNGLIDDKYTNEEECRKQFDIDEENCIESLTPAQYHDYMVEEIWKKHRTDLNTITKFFEQVATCKEKKLCDQDATMALFGVEAKEFWQVHYPFFMWQRFDQGIFHSGVKLEKFIEKVDLYEEVDSDREEPTFAIK